MADILPTGVSAPGAASYSIPTVDFSPIGNWVKDYYSGEAMKRQSDIANTFKNGAPRNPDGTIDFNKILDTSMRLGGVPAAQGLLQQYLGLQTGAGSADEINRPLVGGSPTPSSPVAAAAPSAPAAVTAPPAARAASSPTAGMSPNGFYQPKVAPQASAGSEGARQDTLSNVVQAAIPDAKTAGNVIAALSRQLKVDADAPIDPNDPTVQRYIAAARGGVTPTGTTASVQVADATPNAAVASRFPQAPMPAPAAPAPGAAAAPAGTGAPGPAGPPVAATAPGSPPPGPAAGPAQPPAAAPANPAAALVPPGAGDPGVFADRLSQAAQSLRARAARVSMLPNGAAAAKPLEDQATAYEARATAIREVLGKNAVGTPEMQNARAAGMSNPLDFAREQEGQKLDVANYGKLETGIRTAAEAADVERPKLALLKQAMNDPDYWSGAGNNAMLAYKRAIAALDPQRANAAKPIELGTKIASDQALNSIKALAAGGGVGPIRVAEMRLIEKANYSPNNTPATNRTLVEIADRSFKRVEDINQLRDQYLSGQVDGKVHPRLDRGWDRVLDQYRNSHPLFTDQELKDPRLIGAPTVTPDQVRLVPKGQPYYTTDGRLGMGR